jgi:hypothetical protein
LHEYKEAPVRAREWQLGGLEEEAAEGFKYRINQNIQRMEAIKLDERIVGDVGTASVTIH